MMRRLLILVLIGGASLNAQSIKVVPSTHVATGSAEHPIVEPHLAVTQNQVTSARGHINLATFHFVPVMAFATHASPQRPSTCSNAEFFSGM